jgi:hypothetical protein
MAEVHILPPPAAPVPPAPKKRARQPVEKWRREFTNEAAAEVSAIAQSLLRDPHDLDGDLIRCLGMRLEALACVLTSCTDPGDTLDEVACRLFGPVQAGQVVRRLKGAQP